SGGRLSSGFGARSAPTKGASTNHKGVDWAVPIGTTVVASNAGTVSYAGWASGYGYAVYINHADGRQTRYGHLSKVLVKVGQSVSQGERIALSGNTGRSTGPHLHFEIRINGSAVNPLKYLN
ncbi:MAG: M23 family metallopeptidase, partial [Lachnospiraceae bacterium]|nr:M23 family metallopeptidase [Lachnospiraceae bacterium]